MCAFSGMGGGAGCIVPVPQGLTHPGGDKDGGNTLLLCYLEQNMEYNDYNLQTSNSKITMNSCDDVKLSHLTNAMTTLMQNHLSVVQTE